MGLSFMQQEHAKKHGRLRKEMHFSDMMVNISSWIE